MLDAAGWLAAGLFGALAGRYGFFRAAGLLGAVLLAGALSTAAAGPTVAQFRRLGTALPPEQLKTLIHVGLLLPTVTLLAGVALLVAPGPVRLPPLLDRIGGYAAGAAAGLMVVGLLAAAAGHLPGVGRALAAPPSGPRHEAAKQARSGRVRWPWAAWPAFYRTARDGALAAPADPDP